MDSNKSHEETSSGPEIVREPFKPPPRSTKKRRDKPDPKRLPLRTAENSDDEHPDGEESAGRMDFHAGDFGNAGAWPVDTKHDSAGAPVRGDPEVPKVEKKESKKRHKKIKDQPPKIKDQAMEKKKEKEKMHQPPSSDNHKKAPETVTEGETTTKRNLHLIKTEEDRTRTVEDTERGEEERKRRRRMEKKRSKKKMKKKKTSGEKIGGEGEKRMRPITGSLKRQKVERGSIHVDKQKEWSRPKVERAPIKPESWHDVEREPLEKIMPHVQYDNLPEDPLMRELKPPPRDPHAYPFSIPSQSPFCHENQYEIITNHDKKAATEREKKEKEPTSAISAGQLTTGNDLTETNPAKAKFSLKKVVQNTHPFIWMVVVILSLLCLGLTVAVGVLHKNNGLLAEELRELKEKGGMSATA